MPSEKSPVYRAVDGEVLPVLAEWLRRRGRTTGSWDRRYFRVDPDTQRLYYLTKGPVDVDVDCSVGVFSSLGKALSSTYHKIVDGEDPGESWVDLRLISDVDFVGVRRGRKTDATRFDIDLG